MQKLPFDDLIFLGLHWRYLQDAGTGYPVHGKGNILSNIEAVFKKIREFNFGVTETAAHGLGALWTELSQLPPDATLTQEKASELRGIMAVLQQTLAAEANRLHSYLVTDKRLPVEKLINSVSGLFRPGVFERLPIISQFDFAEAGKCIAFERATAAAFHLLRGTEDVLRAFYCIIVRRNRISPLLWGPMTTALRERRKPPAPELLQNLDNIRVSFRNPTQHPEKIYDIHEVQDLFSLCLDVVNRMGLTLPKAKATETSELLALSRVEPESK